MMMLAKILVVDDEQDIVALIRYNLVKEGFQVVVAYDATTANDLVWKEQPDLLVLDLMLPDTSGVKLCQQLKAEWQHRMTDPITGKLIKPLRVLMLTARTAEEDRILGFESGADDYVTKPFSPRELILRIKAILNRDPVAASRPATRTETHDEDGTLSLGNGRLVLDPHAHSVVLDGTALHVTPIEYRILETLMKTPGKVKRREQLLIEVWQDASDAVMDRTVDANMKRLRSKLGECRDMLETIRGVGYRLNLDILHKKVNA
jgi:DNA-binding response OmpR family regulator